MRLPASLMDLAPESARLCLDTQKILANLAGGLEGRHFLVSLSGGSDSTCLAVVLRLLARRHNFYLSALHFDHNCRIDSGTDAEFVSSLCAGMNLKLETVRFDMAKFARSRKCGLEEAGHIARRNYCLNFARKNGIDCIMLAHHADDLLEDILLRLLRGTAWPGLGGMRQKNGLFLRPFLFFPKSILRDFLAREHIPWREDASNASMDFRRNRLRHSIVPLLKKENPGIARSVRNLNLFAEVDRDYWTLLLDGFFKSASIDERDGHICLRLEKTSLLKEARAFRLRIYASAIARLLKAGGIAGQGRGETLISLDDALVRRVSGKTYQLPGGMEIEITRTHLLFRIKSS